MTERDQPNAPVCREGRAKPAKAPHADGAHGGHHVHARRKPPENALIIGRGLGVTRNGRVILEHVDLDISAGEIVTLIGPNGAGKTTLVRLLLGLMRADRGAISRAPSLVIGYVPQRFDIDRAIPITVDRFLRLGGKTSAAAIEKVLAEVGAGHVRDSQLFHLSGGELQRVVLARALLRQPQLLVLDEPVRGVDFVGEAELYDLIGTLRQSRGLGVLLVSHDLHVVMARSDRVICVNGHVCCEGRPERVAMDPEYKRLFGPAAADALAVYRHHHDHDHDLAGHPVPLRDPSPSDGG